MICMCDTKTILLGEDMQNPKVYMYTVMLFDFVNIS
jgi:hypothetical protein